MDLVISDIHADVNSLNIITEIVFSDKFKKKYGIVKRIINLGDVLDRGFYPKQVLDKLSRLKINHEVILVLGNHDESQLFDKYAGGNSKESADAHDKLSKKDLEFFEKNPDGTIGHHEMVDKKNRLVLVHGGPIDPKKIIPKKPETDSLCHVF